MKQDEGATDMIKYPVTLPSVIRYELGSTVRCALWLVLWTLTNPWLHPHLTWIIQPSPLKASVGVLGGYLCDATRYGAYAIERRYGPILGKNTQDRIRIGVWILLVGILFILSTGSI